MTFFLNLPHLKHHLPHNLNLLLCPNLQLNLSIYLKPHLLLPLNFKHHNSPNLPNLPKQLHLPNLFKLRHQLNLYHILYFKLLSLTQMRMFHPCGRRNRIRNVLLEVESSTIFISPITHYFFHPFDICLFSKSPLMH